MVVMQQGILFAVSALDTVIIFLVLGDRRSSSSHIHQNLLNVLF